MSEDIKTLAKAVLAALRSILHPRALFDDRVEVKTSWAGTQYIEPIDALFTPDQKIAMIRAALNKASLNSSGEGWGKKRKGCATIYTHPDVERAIVDSPYGVFYAGTPFPSVTSAKHAALAAVDAEKGNDDE